MGKIWLGGTIFRLADVRAAIALIQCVFPQHRKVAEASDNHLRLAVVLSATKPGAERKLTVPAMIERICPSCWQAITSTLRC
jgi:hypothetical protein